ncbi:hypothetical protein, partial [Stenotrophomonas maltophilia group sp. RNC7]|uniref:hypothetical protein n=1 Tax=Stenotrophomonas maltophilia group sp. RNC7 TaxID=3071467 RepID=UPI0027E16ED9
SLHDCKAMVNIGAVDFINYTKIGPFECKARAPQVKYMSGARLSRRYQALARYFDRYVNSQNFETTNHFCAAINMAIPNAKQIAIPPPRKSTNVL